MTTPLLKLPYTRDESEAAHRDWNASCGHHSIAAACRVSLDQVKEALPKVTGWMNPTMVHETLRNLCVPYTFRLVRKIATPQDFATDTPKILRIQWEGSWLNPGVPIGAAYQKTHYIAVWQGRIMDPMADVNTLLSITEWTHLLPMLIKECIPKATGWHFTHVWELSNSPVPMTGEPKTPDAVHKDFRGREFHFNDHVCVEGLMSVPDERRTGRLVQVREKCGQFGSCVYFIRLRNGDLATFENAMIRSVDDQRFEDAFYRSNGREPPVIPYQPPHIDDEATNTYTIMGEWPETGFVIEKPAQPQTPGCFTILITNPDPSTSAPPAAG